MRYAIAVLLLFALCFVAIPAKADDTGVIEGVVTDDSGSPLPGVTVDVISTANAHRTVVTDEHGRCRIERLAAGAYDVVADLGGFVTLKKRVTLGTGSVVTVHMALAMSQVAETITVTAMSTVPTGRVRMKSKHFEDHAFVETKKERTATFAIDVDRASYAAVRSYLAGGERPSPDTVRIEEMLNYFRWSYPQPAADAPFSVTTEVAGCPWSAGHRLVRIGIQGRELERWKMPASNLVFLIDVSGSMQTPESLPLLQSALHVLVDQLRAEDRVSLVVYAGEAGLVLPSTSGADKAAILEAIDRLEAGGSTAGGEGIELAYKIAKQNFIAGGNNRVILATDGDFNVGLTDVDELQKMIEKKRRSGIELSVIGVGSGDDELMETLADNGDGNYAYLDSLHEAEKVFREELAGTLITVAKDMKVQIKFDPAAVASYRQIGYENRALENADFENDEKDAGELGAGHSVTALFEIVPTAANATNLAMVRIRYKDPSGRKSTPFETAIVDEGKSAYDASPDMQFAAAIVQFGMLLRDAKDKGGANWDDVLQLARVARGADLDGTRAEFVRLAEEARSLDR